MLLPSNGLVDYRERCNDAATEILDVDLSAGRFTQYVQFKSPKVVLIYDLIIVITSLDAPLNLHGMPPWTVKLAEIRYLCA